MNLSTWQLLTQASVVVKGVLIVLWGFSILSWAIIIYKGITLRGAAAQCAAFVQGGEAAGPVARVAEAIAHARGSGAARELALEEAMAAEVSRLDAYLPFLATTASSTPFIGLLGTVWGIMDAFRGIGETGSASLAVISPAIAEALVTTAAGLLAAIPALIAYNAFLTWNRKVARTLDGAARRLKG
jgi:biopolymer transport protein TolQ